MFGMGTTEILIILGVAVLIFGAKRLPALGRGLGEGLRGFKESLRAPEEDDKKKGEIQTQKPNNGES